APPRAARASEGSARPAGRGTTASGSRPSSPSGPSPPPCDDVVAVQRLALRAAEAPLVSRHLHHPQPPRHHLAAAVAGGDDRLPHLRAQLTPASLGCHATTRMERHVRSLGKLGRAGAAPGRGPVQLAGGGLG